jgi:hypothetical protein
MVIISYILHGKFRSSPSEFHIYLLNQTLMLGFVRLLLYLVLGLRNQDLQRFLSLVLRYTWPSMK